MMGGRNACGSGVPGNWIKRILLSRGDPELGRAPSRGDAADARCARHPRVARWCVRPGYGAPEHASRTLARESRRADVPIQASGSREGWRALAEAFAASEASPSHGDGGPDEFFLPRLFFFMAVSGGTITDIRRLDGRIAWPGASRTLLRGAHASYVLGPIPRSTIWQAARGCANLALFGPTDRALWGPGGARTTGRRGRRSGTIQHRHKVGLVQNPFDVPALSARAATQRLDSRAMHGRAVAASGSWAEEDQRNWRRPNTPGRRGRAVEQRTVWMARWQANAANRARTMIAQNLTPRMGGARTL